MIQRSDAVVADATMMPPAASHPLPEAHGQLPSALALGLRRGAFELKEFLRDREAVFFTLLFPLMLLVLFGSIFSGEIEGTGVSVSQVMAAGIIASGILSVSFVNLAMGIAYERETGVLRRLGVTPMPKSSYFIGKVLMVLVLGVAETALLLGVATAFFDLELPSTPGRWFAFGWVFLLGITSGALLGIAVSSVPKHAKTAAAVVQPPFIFLQFVSGVFLLYHQLPAGLQQVGALFPMKWMTQGLRSALLPDTFQRVEAAGSWERPLTFVVLLAWAVGGCVLCRVTFRWKRRSDG